VLKKLTYVLESFFLFPVEEFIGDVLGLQALFHDAREENISVFFFVPPAKRAGRAMFF
jgi:hypothetical protein